MSFANPFGLLLLLALPIIILLHLFRQERRRHEVSSLYLWREISDQHSRRMRPRLLRNVNLLLQLLAVLLAALALAQPVISGGTAAGARELILLIDDSASMRADTDGVPRMELARNRAREIIGRAPRGTRIMLLTAGPRPAVLQAFTVDRATLYQLVRDLEPTDGANDLPGALRLVRGLGASGDTDLVFVTDGSVRFPSETALPSNLSIASVVTPSAAGRESANRAITAFELRARPDGAAFEVLAAIANYAEEPATVNFRLSADGETISTRSLDLGPDEERLITATIPRTSGTVYLAELVDNEDALDVDDRAYAAAAGERPIRIQLVTPGNLFLESFLSVYPNAQLVVTDGVDQSREFDIIILDRVAAPARLRGNVVAFGATLPDGPFVAEGTAEPVRAITARSDHPVARGVRLGEIQVGLAQIGELDPRATVIASSAELPLVYAYRTSALTLVATTFSLTSSDLALRSSFPVLMHNIIEWLAPVAPAGDVGYAAVGSIVPLYVSPGEQIVITGPDGRSTSERPRTSPFEYASTMQAGIYQVRGESFQSRFAVSLANPHESDLRPLLISGLADTREEEPSQAAGNPAWQWLALFSLLLLAADWIVWARRH